MEKKESCPICETISRRNALRFLGLGVPGIVGGGFGLCSRVGASERSPKITTSDRVNLALARLKEGFHCSQSVFEAYADDFDLSPQLCRRISLPLAGGSTVGGECGAVGSGYLVLGLRYSPTRPVKRNTPESRIMIEKLQRFVTAFSKRHGSLNCRELLGVDVFTPEGLKQAREQEIFAASCPYYIRDAITILDEILWSGSV